MANDLYYLIESGWVLELVKQYVAQDLVVTARARELASQIEGIERMTTNIDTGVLVGVHFKRGEVHPDFTRPKRSGASYPRRGSDIAKLWATQVGRPDEVKIIREAFGVPYQVEYKVARGLVKGTGSRSIGRMMAECGFMYLSKDGPYVMWLPNITALLDEMRADGVTPVAFYKSSGKFPVNPGPYVFNLPGCRQLEHEEWEIMKLQHQLAERKKAAKSG